VYGKKKTPKSAIYAKKRHNERTDKGDGFRRKQLQRKAVRADLQCLSTTMSQMLDRIAELEAALVLRDQQIADLRQDLAEERALREELQGQVTNLGQNLAAEQVITSQLRQDLAAEQARTADLQEQVTNLGQNLAAEQVITTQLRQDLAAEEASTADLQQRLNKTTQTLATEQAEVRRLTNEIKRMEEDHATNKTAWEKQMNERFRPDIAAIADEVIERLCVSSLSCSAQARLFSHSF
jgi:chromosome segregation ATPase